jgi:hypothetical protein
MHGATIKISSTCFEKIIVHHQEVISAHVLAAGHPTDAW